MSSGVQKKEMEGPLGHGNASTRGASRGATRPRLKRVPLHQPPSEILNSLGPTGNQTSRMWRFTFRGSRKGTAAAD